MGYVGAFARSPVNRMRLPVSGGAAGVPGALSGTIAGMGIAAALLSVSIPLTGTVAGIGGTTGSISVGGASNALSGSVDGIGAATGTITNSAGYDSASTAYFAAMTVQPNSTRKGLLNDLIVGLKSDGVWTALDHLYVMASHDTQASRLDAKSPSGTALSSVNSPTFTTDRGWAGDGATSYLDTSYADNAIGTNWAQNTATIAAWVNVVGTGAYGIGVNNGTATRIGASDFRMHGVTPGGAALLNSTGLQGVTRSDASTVTAYKNGAQSTQSTASTSAATVAGTIQIGRGSAGSFSTHRVAILALGYLTGTQQSSLYTRLNTYLTAIGGA